jgi:hypothetical protein
LCPSPLPQDARVTIRFIFVTVLEFTLVFTMYVFLTAIHLKPYFGILKDDSENARPEDDDMKPRISWRGDGQFFVVSSVSEKGGKILNHKSLIN